MDSKSRDAFFTKSEIAKRFVDKVNEITPFDKFDCVLEPSAGAGRILDHLPFGSIGYDIYPMRDDVIEADFLSLDTSSFTGNVLTIMNPPYGRQSKLAIEFFKKAAEYSNVIATLIPRSWMKYRTQNQLPKGWGLYYTEILPDKAFELDGKDYSVRTCFQVWIKDSEVDKYDWDGYPFGTSNNKVTIEMLKDIDEYQARHGCYTVKPNLWTKVEQEEPEQTGRKK